MYFKLIKLHSDFSILLHIAIVLQLSSIYTVYGWNTLNTNYDVAGDHLPSIYPNIILLDRQRRETVVPPVAAGAVVPTHTDAAVVTTDATVVTNVSATAPSPTTATVSNATANNATAKVTDDINRTTKLSSESTSAPPSVAVTKIPLLGVNGSGQYHGNTLNNTPKVSEPIVPDDDITLDVYKATPEIIKAQHNITNLKYDDHTYYNSTFIGNLSFFNEHWANITKSKPEVHGVLSNSHRRATTMALSFPFPFYGHPLREITIATGGFIYTGDHVHNWLAATQYIAPLMANFDTTISSDSVVKLYDDGEKFTALWENVSLQEQKNKNFTFAVTLYKNGDILFAYKNIPIPVFSINDTDHPVKIGISDAYLTDKIAIHLRTKTIYEYHRVSFKSYEITNNTVLKLVAQPTCLQYDTCLGCVNHDTGFNCSWCEQLKKCSGGTDRKRQDWMLRHCDKTQITNESSCPVPVEKNSNSTSYETDTQINPLHDTIFRANPHEPSTYLKEDVVKQPMRASRTGENKPQDTHSPIGGVVAVFIIVTLVSSLAAWVLYAFKNPHTRSGQLLIKYRPSQWSWRRGEARYTAATIHM